MRVSVAAKSAGALIPTGILFQTAWWSQVKARLGFAPVAADYGASEIAGDVLVFTQTIAEDVQMAHVPYGPEWGPAPELRGPFLESLSDALRPHLDERVAFIRYDLPWDSVFVGDPSWDGPGGLRRPDARIAEMRMNWGTETAALRKAPVDLLVPDTIVVALDDDDDALLARMKPKTRYNIRLAERHGVNVELASVDWLPEFYALYKVTAERNRFAVHSYEHFAAMFGTPRTGPGAPSLAFLLAHHDDDILAGAIIALSGDRATYLFGASANEKRHMMAPYAVQWAAMRIARATGCTTYDLYGVAPSADEDHPWTGIRRFKSGFGGRLIHRAGSWDFPLNPDAYAQYRTFETVG